MPARVPLRYQGIAVVLPHHFRGARKPVAVEFDGGQGGEKGADNPGKFLQQGRDVLADLQRCAAEQQSLQRRLMGDAIQYCNGAAQAVPEEKDRLIRNSLRYAVEKRP